MPIETKKKTTTVSTPQFMQTKPMIDASILNDPMSAALLTPDKTVAQPKGRSAVPMPIVEQPIQPSAPTPGLFDKLGINIFKKGGDNQSPSTASLSDILGFNFGTKGESETPLTPEEEAAQSDQRRKLGLALMGGLSTFGAGISGGDVGAATARGYQMATSGQEQVDKQRTEANQEAMIGKLKDPDSQESKQARDLATQLYGGRVKINPKMSAFEFQQQSPVFDKILQRKLQESAMAAKANQGEKLDPAIKKEMSQVKNYRDNVKAKLARLETLVREHGSNPRLGPVAKEMDQLKKEIAIDYNKMKDPQSMVKEYEELSVGKNLGVQEWGTTDETALESLKTFRDIVDQTADIKLKTYTGEQIPESYFEIKEKPGAKPSNAVSTGRGTDGNMYYLDKNGNPISKVK